ncbi:MAG: cytochrome c peroxidase/glucose/arabinose dehydrogenase [Planctomycetota bacterium]|jgi:cytochrome c peroxidase/glucose/arabinose dehydrogenase
MNAQRKLTLTASLILMMCSCSDPKGASQLATGGTAPQPASASQDPVKTTLLETLLARRTGTESIFIADCRSEKWSESPALRAIGAELTKQKIPFKQPLFQKYTYYVNRLIPLLRQKGKVWLLYNHDLEELSTLLKREFLDRQLIEFEHRFPEGTLALVTNKFSDKGDQAYLLEAVSNRGGMTTNIVFAPDDSLMFVSSKEGVIRWNSTANPKANGTVIRMPRAKKGQEGVFSGGESGLVGLALHPDFAQNRRLFLHYNWEHADGKRSAITSEWRLDQSKGPKEVGLVDERKILVIEQTHDTHNAGCLKFGPDGFLYISIGDGHQGKVRERSPANNLRGKVLRIDVDKHDQGKEYAIPSDNPYVDDAVIPAETWAWGFRNPWRISFTPNGRLIAGDIGEDINEELTFVVKGKHHGWPYIEGAHKRFEWAVTAEQQPSLLPYDRSNGMSVIAGQVYQGKELTELNGRFVFADYLSGNIWAIDLPDDTSESLTIDDAELLLQWPLMMTTITSGPRGEIFFGTHTGEVYRLTRGKGAAIAVAVASPADPAVARSSFATDLTTTPAATSNTEQIAIGAQLFGDTRISAAGKVSCATCHVLDNYGQDGRETVAGSNGTARNTPSIFNASRQYAQFRDYRAGTVEEAAIDSLTTHMGHASKQDAIAHISGIPDYKAAFTAAFPDTDAISSEQVGQALGGFVRQLNTSSRWDRFLDGDDTALTREELVGLNEFTMAGCVTCHQYRGLGGGMQQKLGLFKLWTGPDKGRGTLQPDSGQDYMFKVPSLFNVEKTGPYYHDGSMKTLGDAVRNMAEIQLNRKLSDSQVGAIVTFLNSLTGELPADLRK